MAIMLRKFLESLTGAGRNNVDGSHALLYYVKGYKCGAITRVRIDTRNELSRNEDDQFFVRKVIVDSRCYGQVEIQLLFDARYREVERHISGGEFVDQDAWDNAQRANLKSD
jgi:hypothetical protein